MPDQVVVDRRGQQQRRDRGELGGGVAVGQHDELRTVGDGAVDLLADLLQARLQPGAAVGDAVQATDHDGGRAAVVGLDVHDLGQVVVVHDGERQHDHA